MESMKMFKKLVVIMLSLVFIIVCANVVFAADDDVFLEINQTNNNTSSNTSNTNSASTQNNTNTPATNNTTNTNSTNNTNSTKNTTLSTNNTSNSTKTNTNTNRSVSNTNSLANTGLAQTGGIIALIVVICGVSAIYSYKKVNDYKNL